APSSCRICCYWALMLPAERRCLREFAPPRPSFDKYGQAVFRRFLRNYGQVLILNAHGGYRLGRIPVERSHGSQEAEWGCPVLCGAVLTKTPTIGFIDRDPVGRKVGRKMRRTLLILVGTVTGLAVSLITTQPQLLSDRPHAQAAANTGYHQLSLFKEVFERVRDNYVEKPDDAKLIKFAINGMLTGLDPHSSYMDSKDLHEMQVETRGEFGGIGIELTMEDGLIKVTSPIDGTPAAK